MGTVIARGLVVCVVSAFRVKWPSRHRFRRRPRSVPRTSVTAAVTLLVFVGAGCAQEASSPPPAVSAGGAWPQFRGDAQRSGRATWQGASAHAVVDWQRTIGEWDGGFGEPPMYRSSPVVAQSGTVFIGAARPASLNAGHGTVPHLYAFSSTGDALWQSTLAGFAVYGAPAIGPDGRMMVTGYKFDEDDRPVARAFIVSQDGQIVATVAHSHYGASSPLVDDEGNFFYRDPTDLWEIPGRDHSSRPVPVHVASNAGDITTGSTAMDDFFDALADLAACFPGCDFDSSVRLPAPWIDWTNLPAPADAGKCGDVAVGLWTQFFRVRAPKVLAKVDGEPVGTPVIGRHGTTAYVTLKDRDMAAVDQTGHVLWRKSWGTPPVNAAVGHLGGTSSETAVCRYSNSSGGETEVRDHQRDRLYVRVANGDLVAITGDTSELIWKVEGARAVGEPVVLSTPEGEQVVIAGEESLSAFRGEDGEQVWSVGLDGPALGSPAVANDRIYVATYTSLYSIELTE
jgi:outer membrane protein assembly factor BamB